MSRLKSPIKIAGPKEIPVICTNLQALQRKRAVVMKSRIMQANRLQAIVAGTLGYSSSMTEKERREMFVEASRIIKCIDESEEDTGEYKFYDVVKVTLIGIDAFNQMEDGLVKSMVTQAKQLPVASWCQQNEQAGFGLPSLATVIGETGDLNLYANPAKVWRRLGCAPYEFEGKVKMGATWKSGREGKLPAIEWEKFGYSPRRRSVAYIIGENLIKQNMSAEDDNGIREAYEYRQRYLDAKVRVFETHPEWDWKDCTECKGKKKIGKVVCSKCGGTGQKCGRAHKHGMLLATKLLLKNLWIEWTTKE